MKPIAAVLHDAIQTVCPIDGVSLGKMNDKSTWRIDFKSHATSAERQAAQSALTTFDVAVEEQKMKDAADAVIAAKDDVKTKLGKAVTFQDLVDLGLV